jgi:hypothetical protein
MLAYTKSHSFPFVFLCCIVFIGFFGVLYHLGAKDSFHICTIRLYCSSWKWGWLSWSAHLGFCL